MVATIKSDSVAGYNNVSKQKLQDQIWGEEEWSTCRDLWVCRAQPLKNWAKALLKMQISRPGLSFMTISRVSKCLMITNHTWITSRKGDEQTHPQEETLNHRTKHMTLQGHPAQMPVLLSRPLRHCMRGSLGLFRLWSFIWPSLQQIRMLPSYTRHIFSGAIAFMYHCFSVFIFQLSLLHS